LDSSASHQLREAKPSGRRRPKK